MSPVKLELEGQPEILDIRQGISNFNLKSEIVNGLTSQPRSIPSLLLWDDRGQTLFDRFSQRPAYYPFHSEMELLNQYGSTIGAKMPMDGILLELGAGAIHKTKLILSGFQRKQKPVQYFALDVSYESLCTSLTELRKAFEGCDFITITGLLGTYDDCLTWLSGLQHVPMCSSATIMWLGNSIANMESQDLAATFLERFNRACRCAQLECRFIVSTDICQKNDKVDEAYDIQGPELGNFLINALDSANNALGYSAFSAVDWKPYSWLDNYERTLHCCLTAKHDVLVPIRSSVGGNETVIIREGERLDVITSGKWSEAAMRSVCEQAGFRIQQSWKDGPGDYCVFLLEQEEPRGSVSDSE